jgi:pyridoxal phosphate enzyme (YggS family)
MELLAENIERIEEFIHAAARRSGRQPEDIRLVAVTKLVEADRVRAAVALGVREIGENYVQEAVAKLPTLAGLPITRHFIGHLQRNKVSRTLELFDMVQSVDNLPLAQSLSRRAEAMGRELEVLLEVSLQGSDTRAGVAPEGTLALVEQVAPLAGLRLTGLMGIAPLGATSDETRQAFRQLRRLFDRLPAPHRQTLSMGMTGDFEMAIEEGSTMVRIGTGIFGERRTPA